MIIAVLPLQRPVS